MKRELNEKLSRILSTETHNDTGVGPPRKYGDLPGSAFILNVALRIERGSYINDGSSKTGDLTLETINKLIKEGKCDAWFSIIKKSINDMKLDDYNNTLVNALDLVWQKSREKDYEDNDSYVYRMLTDFIENVKDKQQLETYQSAKLIKSAEEILTILN